MQSDRLDTLCQVEPVVAPAPCPFCGAVPQVRVLTGDVLWDVDHADNAPLGAVGADCCAGCGTNKAWLFFVDAA